MPSTPREQPGRVVALALVLAVLGAGLAKVLFLDGALPGPTRGAWPLAVVAPLFLVSEHVRVRYHRGTEGEVNLSLGAFAWAALVPVATFETVVLGSVLGGGITLATQVRRPSRLLFAVVLNAFALIPIWAVHRAFVEADGPDALAWAVIVATVVVVSALQIPVIGLAMRLNGTPWAGAGAGRVGATSALVAIMAVIGVAATELLLVSPWAVLLVAVMVGPLVLMTDLLDARGRLVAELELERDDKFRRSRQDALTGLPNRVEFVSRLDHVSDALREAPDAGGRVAVLLLDLNRFREFNETLGHDLGDRLLTEVALRLSSVARDADLVARLGGDEYAVLVRDVVDAQSAMGAARRILRSLERPYEQGGLLLETGASIGIVLCPDHGGDATTLLRRAEIAMYGAKDAGLGIAVYEDEGEPRTPRRLRLVGDLRRAIEDGRIEVAYQPKLDLARGSIVGVEALARWTNAEDGLIEPAEFIPIAERTGLIHRLTREVIERAFRDVAAWSSEGVRLGVAINVSPRALVDDAFSEFLATRILRNGLAPDQVTLEVTESVVISESARIAATLRELEEMGVRLSIDDYGTGYSSLSYLRRLKVDELKIDRSFVLGMTGDRNDEVLVESTIKLGHALGLVVVAEGVEDAAALERLRELGCDVAQGYHISGPLAAGDVLPIVLRQGVASP